MDDPTFDRVSRLVSRATSRRATLGGFVGLGLGAALAGPGAEVSAKQKKPKTCPAGMNVCTIPSFKKARKANCGPKSSRCVCVTGTSATICASFADSLCDSTRDMCQTDADCDAITGQGSACVLFSPKGICSCGVGKVKGFKACQAPCPGPGAKGQGKNKTSAATRVHFGPR